ERSGRSRRSRSGRRRRCPGGCDRSPERALAGRSPRDERTSQRRHWRHRRNPGAPLASAHGPYDRAWGAPCLALVSSFLAVALGAGAGPALARTCGTLTIQNGTVSPASGTTATTFAFSVE